MIYHVIIQSPIYTFHIVSALLAGIVSFSMGLFVLAKGKKESLNRAFFMLNTTVAIWNFADILIATSSNETEALFRDRISYISAFFIPLFFSKVIFEFINISDRYKRLYVSAFVIIGCLLVFDFTPLFLKRVIPYPFLEEIGPAYILFVIYFLSLVIYSLWVLFSHYKKMTSPLKKTQIRYVFVGLGMIFIAGSFYFVTLIDQSFPTVHYVLEIAYVIVFSYAILKHRLMDIHIIIRGSIVVSMLAVVLTSLYVTGVVFVTKYLNMDIFGIRLLVIAFILSTLVVFHRTIKHMIEGVMLIREKDEKEELDELYQNLATTLDLKEIKWVVISELESIFRTRCVTLVLFDLKERRFKVYASVGYEEIEKVYVAKESPLVVWLMNNNRPAVYDWLDAEREEDKKVQDVMDELNMEVAMVLAHNDTMVGMLGLAEKKRRRYTADEIVLFAEFCEKMAVPFTNAVKYRLNVGQDDEDEQGGKLPSIPVPPNLNEPGKPKIYFRGVEVKDDPKDPFSVCIGPLHAVNRKWDWIKMRDSYDPTVKEIRLAEEEKKDGEDEGDDAS